MDRVDPAVSLDPGEAFAQANGLRLCHQTFGRASDPPLLLIHGLGAQMIVWDDDFCEALAARGYRVIRFDNRDIGKSSHIAGPSFTVAALMTARKPGERLEAPYLLKDMAADAVGLLDALGIERAHVVGASMGGMIAQEMAIGWPARVASLTSIMSTTGDAKLPPAKPELNEVLMAPPPRTRDEFIAANLRAWKAFRGAGFPQDEARDLANAERAAARGFDPDGPQRQLLAIIASGNRKATLPTITAPTLVIHGEDDPLVRLAAGEDTARSIPGARLVVVKRMGHNISIPFWPQIIDAIASIAR